MLKKCKKYQQNTNKTFYSRFPARLSDRSNCETGTSIEPAHAHPTSHTHRRKLSGCSDHVTSSVLRHGAKSATTPKHAHPRDAPQLPAAILSRPALGLQSENVAAADSSPSAQFAAIVASIIGCCRVLNGVSANARTRAATNIFCPASGSHHEPLDQKCSSVPTAHASWRISNRLSAITVSERGKRQYRTFEGHRSRWNETKETIHLQILQ